jgi:hypothetical protein
MINFAPAGVNPDSWIGSSLVCKIRGRVTVGGMTSAPIRWPYAAGRGGKPPLILCGDLVRAVRTESAAAVAYHWGVDRSVVHDWRQALGVGRFTVGTKLRWQELRATKLNPAVVRAGARAAHAVRRAKRTTDH